MENLTDDEIYRSRILIDDKPLKRLQRKFNSLASSRGPEGEDLSAEELQSMHTSFVAELHTLFSALHHKSHLIPLASTSDSQSYNETLASISHQQEATQAELTSLASDLAAAQSERANKMAYDGIAAQINAIPSRGTSQETIERLEREMSELQQQSEVFKGTWARRKDAFGKIVGQLEELGEEVREEKGEQERRQAMDEDEGEAEDQVQTAEGSPREDNADKEDPDADAAQQPHLNPEAASFKPSEGTNSNSQAEQKSSGGDKRGAQQQEQGEADQDMEDGEMADG